MRDFKGYLRNPFADLNNTFNLVLCALLMAMGVGVSFISIHISSSLRISFYFIFVAIIAMKFGPLIAASASAMTDVIQYLMRPEAPFQPLLTLGAALSGIVFGLFLYRNKGSLVRVIIARTIDSLIVSAVINTYFISLLFGKVFTVFFVGRLVKCLIMLPIEIIILYAALRLIGRIEKNFNRS